MLRLKVLKVGWHLKYFKVCKTWLSETKYAGFCVVTSLCLPVLAFPKLIGGDRPMSIVYCSQSPLDCERSTPPEEPWVETEERKTDV
ncbi:hypothetical protein CHS0354_027816 [Potamilus streckersoni]|uniref:Uncharacterized protein n=1 Tax=Potamilus streckersoni TaxID=2493646 RepID=A0AAE0T0K1_9BIVA|nr:hypothetical protein CHS0354_027816 [Potamilus streckersoni]